MTDHQDESGKPTEQGVDGAAPSAVDGPLGNDKPQQGQSTPNPDVTQRLAPGGDDPDDSDWPEEEGVYEQDTEYEEEVTDIGDIDEYAEDPDDWSEDTTGWDEEDTDSDPFAADDDDYDYEEEPVAYEETEEADTYEEDDSYEEYDEYDDTDEYEETEPYVVSEPYEEEAEDWPEETEPVDWEDDQQDEMPVAAQGAYEDENIYVPEREGGDKKGASGFLYGLAWLFSTGTILGTVAIAVVAAFLINITEQLPSADVMKDYEPPITTRIHAGDGSLIAEFARERRLFVPIDKIPDQLIQAFVAAEDKTFFSHEGVDPRGIVRAAIKNYQNAQAGIDSRQGASTITQQVARNFLLSSEQSYERKLKEALIAVRMEEIFTKQKIMELYLNQIYLGWRSYGVAAAALNYFDKSLEELTLGEMAFLAVLPKAPNNYHPIKEKERALERREYVLNRMMEDGYVNQADVDAAKAEELVVYERATGAQNQEAEYFAEEVRRQLYELYDEEGLYGGGLSVRTSMDPDLQALARRSLRAGLEEYDRRHGWRGPFVHLSDLDTADWVSALEAVEAPTDLLPWKIAAVLSVTSSNAQVGLLDGSKGSIPFEQMKWARPWLRGERVGAAPSNARNVLKAGDVVFVEAVSEEAPDTFALKQIPAVNGALGVMDPHSGRVLALVGGFSFDGSEFNRATQALRQPGSSFKPIVYATALDRGYTPSSIVLDGPLVVDQGPGLPLWKPKNYTSRYYGESTLRVGIEQSRNLMTARLALDMGMKPIVDYARKFGVKEDLQPMPAMALGAGETTLVRMLGAYSIMINGGWKVRPTLIDQIQDRYGMPIHKQDGRDCPGCSPEEWTNQEEPVLPNRREQTLDPRTAFQIVSMMEGAILRGTGRKMRSLNKPFAGKTGTTNEARDAWFIGFTPDLLAGAYVGFDQPRSLGPRETGGGVALPIVKRFFEGALEEKPAVPFRVPPGLKLMRVNLRSGMPTSATGKGSIMEAFKPGTEPTWESKSQRRITFGEDGLPVDMAGSSTGATNVNLGAGSGGLY